MKKKNKLRLIYNKNILSYQLIAIKYSKIFFINFS